MFNFNTKYVFWSLIAVAALSLFGYVVRLSSQVDRYRNEANQNEVTIEALKDSTRIITGYWEDAEAREVAARKSLPDVDSLRGAVRKEVFAEIVRRGGTVTASGEVIAVLPDTIFVGTEDGVGTDTLYFRFTDETNYVTVNGEIWVYPLRRQMARRLALIPKPQSYKFYTVQVDLPGGAKGVEFWADVPGEVKKIRTYILPEALPPRDAPKVTRQFYAGIRAMGSSDGWFAVGPEVGTRGKLWIFDMEVGAGVDVSKVVYHGFGQLKIGVTF